MAKKREKTLANAVLGGDRARVEKLLAEGAAPQSRDDLNAALGNAVCTFQPGLVEILLRHGADPNGTVKDGSSFLHQAATAGSLTQSHQVVRLLVEHGASLDARNEEGASPFLVAVREAASQGPAAMAELTKGMEGLAGLLRMMGSQANLTVPAPVVASPAERCAMIDLLLSLGARIDDRDASGNTAAVIAFLEQDEGLLAALEERGASTAEVDTARLVVAASEGRADEVEALLARGVDPNRRFTGRGTPLSEAAQEGHLAVVEHLLRAGADPNLSERESGEGDFNPLFRAVYFGHLEILRRLLAAGGDPLRKGPGGARLLDYAKVGASESHKAKAPWDEILAVLQEALRAGPARIGLSPVQGEPAVIAELRAALPELAGLSWSRARAAGRDILESAPLPEKAAPDWDRLREIAGRHGFAPLFSPWSLQDCEPDVPETERNLAAIDAAAGRDWIAREVEEWRQAARKEAEELADGGDEDEEEDEESSPRMLRIFESGRIDRSSRGVLLQVDGHRLVLLGGAPEAAAVLYGFHGSSLEPVLLASILKTWRETVGAELAAFTRDTLSLVLPRPIEDEAEVRRRALELYVVDPDLYGARHILALTASRHWPFWWD